MNPQNDVLRYNYRVHLTEAKGADPKTVEGVMRHLAEYEVFTGFRDFDKLTKTTIIDFKEHLMSRPAKTSGAKLSASSVVHTLTDLRAFFTWLRKEGRGRKFSANLLDYFAPLRRTAMTARSRLDRPVPRPDDIRAMIEVIPPDSIVERRNRALVAFLFLTGMRDAAAISIRIKHVDLGARQVTQDASEVRTKFGKNMKTSFFPVGDDIESIVTSWVNERCATGAGPDAPLFPSGQTTFNAEALRHEEKAWTTTAPVRKIFKQACIAAGLPYFNPHAVRKTLMRLALTSCKTPEELQAWSQNLGHEQLQTSMVSYGKLDSTRQHELLQDVLPCGSASDETELLEQYRQLSPELQSAVRTLLAAQAG